MVYVSAAVIVAVFVAVVVVAAALLWKGEKVAGAVVHCSIFIIFSSSIKICRISIFNIVLACKQI